jgi:NAD-dependent DNA ligase
MIASNQLGRGLGKNKLKLIMDTHPDILVGTASDEEKVATMLTIKGIGKENAASFVKNIPRMMAFLRECGLETKLVSGATIPTAMPSAVPATDHPLYGKRIVMTKVRDAAVNAKIRAVGGQVDDTMTKQTSFLIVKSKDDNSNKTKYAIENHIPIYTLDEFVAIYLSA